LEITDINECYLERGQLNVVLFRRGMTWLDMGTFDSMLDASLFIQTLQTRQGIKIACPEEIAYRMGYITFEKFQGLADKMQKNPYGQYLREIALEETSVFQT
jgi:glucose-1-phosphate thymidylyltransferase